MDTSPIISIYDELRSIYPKWNIVVGAPSGPGWIRGEDLRNAGGGPFNALLLRMGEQMGAADRRTIAGSFALRYGWSFGMAIAPYVLHQCVPKITLDNVSFLFNEKTWFSGVALHEPVGMTIERHGVALHPSLQPVCSPEALLGWLRASMAQQAEPIVAGLHEWAGFSLKGIWGLITSSWGGQFINVLNLRERGEEDRIQRAQRLFEGDDLIARVQPHFYPVTFRDVTRVYQRRATCCRYYKLPGKHYCTSCPLVSQDERLQRNLDWMQRTSGLPEAKPA